MKIIKGAMFGTFCSYVKNETAFLTIFGGTFGTALLSSAMLLNRGISFYIFMIVSVIVVLINAIRKKNVVGEIEKIYKILTFDI